MVSSSQSTQCLQPLRTTQTPDNSHSTTAPSSPSAGGEPTSQQWTTRTKRHQTNLDDVVVESRATRHAQIFKRPRAFQYRALDDADEKHSAHAVRLQSNTSSRDAREAEERSTDDIPKQLRRIDLFVDLIWVGIVANISATFSELAFTDEGSDPGTAVLVFILLFLPIWRIWDSLRSYTSHYYTDDLVQRLFLVWVLILAILYGVNVPFAYFPDPAEKTSLTLLIVIYIIARASFFIAHAFQAIFIPFLRKQILFDAITTLVPLGLWNGAIFCPYPSKIALLVIANAIEHPIIWIASSPNAESLLLPKGIKKHNDIDRYVERYEGFFIIILGEGVFRLVEGSPAGLGLNTATGVVLVTALLYYNLHWIYFNGDQSREFVHALRRTWWKPVLWQSLHVALFASILFLDASTLYLVKNPGLRGGAPEVTEPVISFRAEQPPSAIPTPEDGPNQAYYTLVALWSASISLGATIVCMTFLALLNRPLDPPNTLLINSRLVRLAPRIPVIAFIVCLPLIPELRAGDWTGAACSVLYGVFLFEMVAGMEKDWKLIEPKEEAEN